MRSILILTKQDDSHASAAAVALQKLNHKCIRWFGADLPIRQRLSVDLSPDEQLLPNTKALWTSETAEEILSHTHVDIVWKRSVKKPNLDTALHNKQLHPDDYEFSLMQNAYFQRAILHYLSIDTFWINSFAGAAAAESKILQLRYAHCLGLKIPHTHISNDPKKIRTFIQNAPPGGVIYKPFVTTRWEHNDGSAAYLPTTTVTEAMLPEDKTLQLTPGIFQHRIPKAYEVRATFFGHTCIAVQMDTQSVKGMELDWRFTDKYEFEIKSIQIPDDVHQKCIQLMQKLGIVFGCFDFIVSPDGDYTFLEVNEMGQFLWIEEYVPSLPILDVFCQFLISGHQDFKYDHSIKPIRLADCEESIHKLDLADQIARRE